MDRSIHIKREIKLRPNLDRFCAGKSSACYCVLCCKVSSFTQLQCSRYGGYTRADNILITPAGGTALASYIAADNTGPPLTTGAVKQVFKAVREVFPNAKHVFGSTWDHFAGAISPQEVATLPRFSSAWGDAWVLGMSSDPGRLQT